MAETTQLTFIVNKDQILQANKALDAMVKKTSAVNTQVTKLKKALSAPSKEFDKLAKRVDKLEKQFTTLADKNTKLKNSLNTTNAKLKTSTAEYKKKDSVMKSQIKTLKEQNKEQGNTIKGLNASVNAIGKAVKGWEQLKEENKKLKEELAKFRGEQNKTITGIQKMEAVIRKQSNSINKNAETFKKASDYKKAYSEITKQGRLILKQYDEQIKQVSLSMRKATSEDERQALATRKRTLETERATAAEKQHLAVQRLMRERSTMITTAMNKMATSIRTVARTLTRYLTTAMAGAIAMGVKMAANIEAQIVRFGVLTGQMEKGAKLYEEIIEYSAKTPFLLPDLTGAAQKLLAFGSPLEDVMDELRMMGDLAMGDAEKLDRIALSFGKVRSRGTAHMRELNRFIMTGVPIIKELNDNIGVTGEELFKMVEKNEITFGHIKQAVESLTSEGGRFHEMTLKVSRTLEGRFSTALDNLRLNLASLFDPFVDDLKEILVNFIDWSQGFRMMSEEARKEVALTVGALAALGPVLLGVAGAVKATAWAFTSLSFAINPVAATIRLLIGLFVGGALVKIWNNLSNALDEASVKAELAAEYTEKLTNAQEYNKDLMPGLTEELYEVAKAHDAVSEAVARGMRIQELRDKKEAGFRADKPAFRKARSEFEYMKNFSAQFTERYANIFNIGTIREELENNISAEDVAGTLQAHIDSVIKELPESEEIFKKAFGTTRVTDFSAEELLGLEPHKLFNDMQSFMQELSREDFMEEAELDWVDRIDEELKKLEDALDFETSLGVSSTSLKDQLKNSILEAFSGYGEAMSEIDTGLSTTSSILNKFRNQQRELTHLYTTAFEKEVKERYEAQKKAYEEGMRDREPELSLIENAVTWEWANNRSKITAQYEDAIDELSDNVTGLVKSRVSEIQTEAESDNLIRALLGITDEKEAIQVIESQIETIIDEIKAFDFDRFMLQDMISGEVDIPEEIQPFIERISDLTDELEVQLAHKKRINLFEAFFEGSLRDVQLNKIKDDISTQLSALSTSLANEVDAGTIKLKEGQTLTDIVFGHMEKGTTDEFINQLDTASQQAYDKLVSLFDRLETLEASQDYTSLLQAMVGSPEDLDAYIQQLQVKDLTTRLSDKITEEIGVDSELDIYKKLLEYTEGDLQDTEIGKMFSDLKELMKEEAEKEENKFSVSDLISYATDPRDFMDKFRQNKVAEQVHESLQEMAKDAGVDILDLLQSDDPGVQKALDLLKEELDLLSPMEQLWKDIADTMTSQVVPAFEQLGESMASGANFGESLRASIQGISQAILNSLPEMMMRAGLEMLVDGDKSTNPMAWALIAGGAGGGFLAGFLGGDTQGSATTGSGGNITYSANGDLFKNGYIANSPMLRSTPTGGSMIGEAGSEAVLPLSRGANGKLGVSGSGGDVYVNVVNNSQSRVETKESENADGTKNIEFMIYDVVKKGMATGEFDSSMSSTFGTKRRGVR